MLSEPLFYVIAMAAVFGLSAIVSLAIQVELIEGEQ